MAGSVQVFLYTVEVWVAIDRRKFGAGGVKKRVWCVW